MGLVNIWATITHLADARFCGANESQIPTLDLLICERLCDVTDGKQTWMINPVWRTPGTTAVLLRDSYREIRDAVESYLVLLTPGFADLLQGAPLELVERYLNEIHARSRAFNKRVITTLVASPPACRPQIREKVEKLNDVVKAVSERNMGRFTDLRDIAYQQWTDIGSRPADLGLAADRIVETILQCHPSMDHWKALREKHSEP